MPTFYPPGTRKGNRFYIVRGSINGREVEFATGAGDKRAAQRAWNTFASAYSARSVRPETFAQVADAYLAAARRSANDTRFVERLQGVLGRMKVGDVRAADIYDAAVRLYPEATNATRNRQAIAPAAAVLHFAHDAGLCEWVRVKRLKETEPETRRPKDGVAKLLIANTEGDQQRFLVFLFAQGWRISETLSLQWENVNLRDRTMRLYVGKAGKWKDVPMSDGVFEALASVAKTEGRVFPWGDRHNVYRWLRPLCKRLRVVFTPHMARHDFGGQLRESGATGRDLVDVGTWTSERSTTRYQNAGSEHHRNVIGRRKFGEIPGKGKVSA